MGEVEMVALVVDHLEVLLLEAMNRCHRQESWATCHPSRQPDLLDFEGFHYLTHPHHLYPNILPSIEQRQVEKQAVHKYANLPPQSA